MQTKALYIGFIITIILIVISNGSSLTISNGGAKTTTTAITITVDSLRSWLSGIELWKKPA